MHVCQFLRLPARAAEPPVGVPRAPMLAVGVWESGGCLVLACADTSANMLGAVAWPARESVPHPSAAGRGQFRRLRQPPTPASGQPGGLARQGALPREWQPRAGATWDASGTSRATCWERLGSRTSSACRGTADIRVRADTDWAGCVEDAEEHVRRLHAPGRPLAEALGEHAEARGAQLRRGRTCKRSQRGE